MMDLKGGGGGVLVYCISKVLTYLILHQIRYPQLLINLALRLSFDHGYWRSGLIWEPMDVILAV